MRCLQVKQPRLEIKRDIKGMVIVPGATVVEVTSAKELMATFEKVGGLPPDKSATCQHPLQPKHKGSTGQLGGSSCMLHLCHMSRALCS